MNRAAIPFLTAKWRYLAMLNFEIDPAVLLSRVPDGTELDFWNGQAIVSVVGFRFLDTQVLGWSIPFHRDFDEVNLRFYVRRQVKGQWRRGVVFIKEIVPRYLIAAVARWAYGENYVAIPMAHEIRKHGDNSGIEVKYAWRQGKSPNWIALTAVGEPQALQPGSEAEFISEHYWGYGRYRGATLEYQVDHPPWRVWSAQDARLEGDIEQLYGPQFVSALSAEPLSAFLAEGSEVKVYRGIALKPLTGT